MKKMNVWRRVPARILSCLLLIVLVAASCKKDDDPVADVSVNFDMASQTLRESDQSADVTMKLTGPAGRDGNLTFTMESTATYGTDYTTSPAAADNKLVVPVVKGQTAVKFTVLPVNNTVLNGDQTIKFTLSSGDAGLIVGDKATETITIIDDEGPSKANFATSEGTLSSDLTDGQRIMINFSSALPSAGTLTISMASTSAVYGTNFTTTPAATDNTITLSIDAGVSAASFTVLPAAVASPLDVTFTLTSPSGSVVLGTQTTFKLTLTPANIISVTALRALYTTATVVMDQDKALVGTVISSADNTTNRNLWLHDGTKGILLRFSAIHTFVKGDKLSVNIKGASLGLFSGVLELGVDVATPIPLTAATKLGAGTLPDYKTITIDNLTTGAYEGDLVKIENVHFTNADGTIVLNGGSNTGNNTFTDAAGTKSAVLRVETYAPFKGNVVPLGVGTLQGIANINGTTYQIAPQAATDIFQSNSAGSLVVSATSLTFGDITHGTESTEQSFTVSGTNLSADVTVTAPANYTVSLSSSGPYASTATIAKADAAAGNVPVYVKFVPASGGNQTLAGSVSVASAGVAAKTVAVTGNEIGNAATALLFKDDFDYGAIDNPDLLSVTSNWVRHSGTLGPHYLATGLTYTGYPSTGGALGFAGSTIGNGDINSLFPLVTTDNNIYVSFLLNLSGAAAQDYFFHISSNPINSIAYNARVYASANGAGWSVALSKSSGNIANDATVLNFNQTYLVVLKYSLSTAAANDDLVTLYIYDSGIPAAESSTSLVKIGAIGAGLSGDSDIGAVIVRQGLSTPPAKIDGIRVALNWADLFN